MNIKKTIKIIIILIAIIFLIAGSAVAILIKTTNQEMIKEKATQFVLKKTGRDLKIDGDISWSLFPWIGIKIQNVSLSNPPDFNNKQFAKAKEVGVKIKLLPLIFTEVKAKDLIIKDLELNLIKNISGRNNWEDLSTPHNKPTQKTTPKKEVINPSRFTISNVVVENGKIFWHNQTTNKKIKIDNLDLECKNVNFDKPFPLQTSFYLANLKPSLDIEIEADTRIRLNTEKKLYSLKKLQAFGKLKNRKNNQTGKFNAKTDLTIDLKKETLNTQDLKLNIANTNIAGSLQGTNIAQKPIFSGKLAISNNNLKETIQLFGMNKFTKKVTASSLKANLELSPKITKLSIDSIKINDMMLKGKATLVKNKVDFNVYLNKLNLDLFKPTEQPQTKTAPSTKTITTSNRSASSSLLPKINLSGKIKIDRIQSADLHLDNFTTKLLGTTSLINCRETSFDFYDGKASGSADIDLRQSSPKLNMHLALINTFTKPLLIDLAKYKKFSGTLSLNTDISAHGKTSKEMLHSLNGSGKILMRDGSYQGVDIPYEVRRAHAILNAKPKPQKPESPHTDFDQLTTTFNINNGLLNTDDLLVVATDYWITGKGNVNLAANNLDLSLNAYSKNDKNFFVPIKVTGPCNKPSIRPDAAVLLKGRVKKALKGAGEKIGEQLEKIGIPKNLKDILPF